jgi:ribosomal protein S18 acetylase RimI-like enzyme
MTIHDITIRTHLVPGDLGYIIYRQGKLYSEEHNFGVSFEAYLSAGIYEFYKNYDASLDRVWICEHNHVIIGFLLLMHRENHTAQLRFFYLERDYRGLGLGTKLMQLYMDFLKEKKYESCYLWTTNEQQAAAALYKKHGFVLTQEVESTAFGKPLTEQRYDLAIQQ